MKNPRYLYDPVLLPNCPDPADPSCEWMSRAVLEAAGEDDVAGSGIFDVTRHQGLEQHIFSGSRGALPGYAARERGDGPSEVIDQQTGTPTRVFLPGWRDGQRMLPSTQPRFPYPDPSLLMGDARELALNGLGEVVQDSWAPNGNPGVYGSGIEVGNEWDAGGFSTMPISRFYGDSKPYPPAVYGRPGVRPIYDAIEASSPVPVGQQGSRAPFPPFAPTPLGTKSIDDATLARAGIPTRVGGAFNPAGPLRTGPVPTNDISRPCATGSPIPAHLYEVPLRPQLSSVLLPVPTIPLDQPCPAYVGRVPTAAAAAPVAAAPRIPLRVVGPHPGGTAAEALAEEGGTVEGGGIFDTAKTLFATPNGGGGPSIFAKPPVGPGATFSKTPKNIPDLLNKPKPGGGIVLSKPGGGIFAKPGGGIFAKPGGGIFAKPGGGMVFKPDAGTTKKPPKQCHPGMVYDPVQGMCVKPKNGGAVYVPGAVRTLPAGKGVMPSLFGRRPAVAAPMMPPPGIRPPFGRGPSVMVARPPVRRTPTMPVGKPVFGTPSIFAKPSGAVLGPRSTRPAMRPPVVLRPDGGFAKKPPQRCPTGQVLDPILGRCVARGAAPAMPAAKPGFFARVGAAIKGATQKGPTTMPFPKQGCPQGQVFDPRVGGCVARGGLWSTAPRGTYTPGAASGRIPVKVGSWKPSTTKGRPPAMPARIPVKVGSWKPSTTKGRPPPPRKGSPLLTARGLRLSGLGEDESSMGESGDLVTWVLGGVALGAAAAIAMNLMEDK